jgi:predicted nucleotidyltransferase
MKTMTLADPNEAAKIAATDFACRIVPHWQAALGTELIGAYLVGSLAHTGFSRRYSDVDIAVITETGLSQQALDRMRSEAVALSAEWGAKLSAFWADRHFRLGRFPPLDRVDYLDHAVVLTERERVQPTRPTLDEIRRYLSGPPLALWRENALRFAASETLDPKDHKTYLKTLLYPGRLFYSWMTGRIGSNDDAVVFLSERHPTGFDVGLLTRALQCRQAAADPDYLFPARTMLSSQVEACAALFAGQVAVS